MNEPFDDPDVPMNAFGPPKVGDPEDPLRDLYRVLLDSHVEAARPYAIGPDELHHRARRDFIEICKATNLGEFLERIYRESAK